MLSEYDTILDLYTITSTCTMTLDLHVAYLRMRTITATPPPKNNKCRRKQPHATKKNKTRKLKNDTTLHRNKACYHNFWVSKTDEKVQTLNWTRPDGLETVFLIVVCSCTMQFQSWRVKQCQLSQHLLAHKVSMLHMYHCFSQWQCKTSMLQLSLGMWK